MLMKQINNEIRKQQHVERKNPEEEFKSRGYQNELLRICLEKNTIIYLPTGAGKTYIAIMALKHFAKTSVL